MIKIVNRTLLVTTIAAAACCLFISPRVEAHCQIPCGIYDDHARVDSMLEDTATVVKSMKLIAELAGKTDAQSQNQLVRWVTNKEKHAQNILEAYSNTYCVVHVLSNYVFICGQVWRSSMC